MLIRMISIMGCLIHLMCGSIQLFPCVLTIFHTSSIQVTPMIRGIAYPHHVRVFLNGC